MDRIFVDGLSNQNDITQQVDQLLASASEQHVSDIHIEPYGDKYRIRLRQDGLLHELTQLAGSMANGIIARLKVLSHLDVAERRLPQDGHFSVQRESNSTIDFRLSSCPTVDGEKIVVRILNSTSLSKQVEELGLEPSQQTLFISALAKPQGLILFIGPTGSGKTVSMYAALQRLNPNEKNIVTIEDPVEINLPGINQVNINPKAGLTFASGLRAFLRQDPDIIMLGEVRDTETAQVLIKIAQTGHLILSTLHAQNTVQVFDRLLNLGLNKNQIQSNLLLLIAQRLVRKLCEICKTPTTLPKKILHHYGLPPESSVFDPVGCQYCQSGYRGRIGVFELLPINSEVISAFSQLNYCIALKELLKKNGLSLRDAALYKVSHGITSLSEIDRVIGL